MKLIYPKPKVYKHQKVLIQWAFVNNCEALFIKLDTPLAFCPNNIY